MLETAPVTQEEVKTIRQSENVALLDMDGTVADYDQALRNEMIDYQSPNDPLYEPHRNGVLAHQRRLAKLLRRQPGWWANLPEIELGFEIVEVVKDLGFKFMVLTKGPFSSPNAWTEKLLWCEQHLEPRLGKMGKDFGVTITSDKGLVYGKILIDDYPAYVERWLTWRPRGLAVMVAQPWNADFQHPNVLRYDGSNIARQELHKRAMEVGI